MDEFDWEDVDLDEHYDITERHTTRVRVIKNRYSGLTGKACALYYDRNTGRMNEVFEEDLEEAK